MKTRNTLSCALAFIVGLAASNQAILGQTTVFSDNFSTGNDTLNGTSVPGGTPTSSWTSFDIAATKAATTTPVINPGDFTLGLNSATTSGFLEAQALFTSTPVTLGTVGDYINLTYTFTDTGGGLLAGGTSSYIFAGLFNSGGNAPAIGLNNGGLAVSGSTWASGNAANWMGYGARIANGGASQIYTRPVQNGSVVTNANQDLLGNGLGAGAFKNPAGTLLTGGNETASVSLTAGSQYTENIQIVLTAAGTLTITNSLFSGAGTGGTLVFSQTNTSTAATYLTTTFDGLAIGARNSGTSFNPIMDISQITVSDYVQPVPEPNSALILAGFAAICAARRFGRRR